MKKLESSNRPYSKRYENSYHDIINTGSGAIEYWGDNRDADKLASDTRGNKIILDALNTIKTQPKELHPIILFFDKRGSGLKGKVISGVAT